MTSAWPDPLAWDKDPLTHPALTEPRTKEDWQAYISAPEPVVPARLTARRYGHLSDVERARYNDERDRHHSALVIAETAALRRFQSKLARVMRMNQNAPAGARAGIVITGPPRTGKSTMIKVVTRRFELDLRRHHPDFFARRGDAYIPVAYLLVPEIATVKSLLSRLAGYYGLRLPRAMNTTERAEKVADTMGRCGTHVLVIDDIHFIDMTDRHGREANNCLKALANATSATFIAAGVDLENGRLFTEGASTSRVTQTSGRYALFKVNPFEVNTEAEVREWVALIRTFEDALVLTRHRPGTLVKHWQYLHDRTSGSIWSLAWLVREAAMIAVDDGTERVTLALLDHVNIDHLSEHTFAQLRRARLRGGR